jgi:hypothetical protein
MFEDVRYDLHRAAMSALQCRPSITIRYPRRFADGKCVLAVLVPAETLTLGTIRNLFSAYWGFHYHPQLLTCTNGLYVRLAFRLPNVRSTDRDRISHFTQSTAVWARRHFEMPVIIAPIGGRIETLQQLQVI